MSDDNYWKKEESYYFVSFYKSSIQGKLTHKERVRDGDFIQVEGTDEEIRLREMKNEVDQNFFEYVSVGNELKKEPYTRNLCIVTNREENCFKYLLD